MNTEFLAVYPSPKLNYDFAQSSFVLDKYSISASSIQEQYFTQNKSQDEIAKELGVSQWVISQRMKKFGLKPKNKTRKIGIRKYHVNDDFFDELNQTTAWVLGWMASDGYIKISPPSKSVQFGIKLSSKDADIIHEIKNLLKFNGPTFLVFEKLEKTNKVYSQLRINMTSKKIVDKLATFGIVPNKTQTISFPHVIEKTKNEEIIRAFIQGVFEGDGSILWDDKRKSACFQIVGTWELMLGVQKQLVYFLDLEETKLTRNTKLSNHFALRYRGNLQVPRIMDWIYAGQTYKMRRKYSQYQKIVQVINS